MNKIEKASSKEKETFNILFHFDDRGFWYCNHWECDICKKCYNNLDSHQMMILSTRNNHITVFPDEDYDYSSPSWTYTCLRLTGKCGECDTCKIKDSYFNFEIFYEKKDKFLDEYFEKQKFNIKAAVKKIEK